MDGLKPTENIKVKRPSVSDAVKKLLRRSSPSKFRNSQTDDDNHTPPDSPKRISRQHSRASSVNNLSIITNTSTECITNLDMNSISGLVRLRNRKNPQSTDKNQLLLSSTSKSFRYRPPSPSKKRKPKKNQKESPDNTPNPLSPSLKKQPENRIIRLTQNDLVDKKGNPITDEHVIRQRWLFLAAVLTTFTGLGGKLIINNFNQEDYVPRPESYSDEQYAIKASRHLELECLSVFCMLSNCRLEFKNFKIDKGTDSYNHLIYSPQGLNSLNSAPATLVNGQVRDKNVEAIARLRYSAAQSSPEHQRLANRCHLLHLARMSDILEVSSENQQDENDHEDENKSSNDANDELNQETNQILNLLDNLTKEMSRKDKVKKVKIKQKVVVRYKPKNNSKITLERELIYLRYLALALLLQKKAERLILGETDEIELMLLKDFFLGSQNVDRVELSVNLKNFGLLLSMLFHLHGKSNFDNVSVTLQIPSKVCGQKENIKFNFSKSQLAYMQSVFAHVYKRNGANITTIYDNQNFSSEHLKPYQYATHVLLFNQAQSLLLFFAICLILKKNKQDALPSSEDLADNLIKLLINKQQSFFGAGTLSKKIDDTGKTTDKNNSNGSDHFSNKSLSKKSDAIDTAKIVNSLNKSASDLVTCTTGNFNIINLIFQEILTGIDKILLTKSGAKNSNQDIPNNTSIFRKLNEFSNLFKSNSDHNKKFESATDELPETNNASATEYTINNG